MKVGERWDTPGIELLRSPERVFRQTRKTISRTRMKTPELSYASDWFYGIYPTGGTNHARYDSITRNHSCCTHPRLRNSGSTTARLYESGHAWLDRCEAPEAGGQI